jgi:hypothetical protein
VAEPFHLGAPKGEAPAEAQNCSSKLKHKFSYTKNKILNLVTKIGIFFAQYQKNSSISQCLFTIS